MRGRGPYKKTLIQWRHAYDPASLTMLFRQKGKAVLANDTDF